MMHRLFWRVPYAGAIAYAAALGALACAVYWYAGYRDLAGMHEAYTDGEVEAVQLQETLNEDKQRAEELEAHVAGLDRSDPVELEAAARKNKNVVREGEKIYRFDLAPERPERTATPGKEHP